MEDKKDLQTPNTVPQNVPKTHPKTVTQIITETAVDCIKTFSEAEKETIWKKLKHY